QPVEMAAVLRGEPAEERRLPERLEAGPGADGRQAAEQRIDEDDAAGRVHSHVMEVDVAGGMRGGGDVQPGIAVCACARGQEVLQAPQLEEGTHPDGLAVAAHAQAAIERTLEDRQAPVRLQADEEELSSLVRGEGEAEALLGEPVRELTRS